MPKEEEKNVSTPKPANEEYQYATSELETLRAILENRKKSELEVLRAILESRKKDDNAENFNKDENGNNAEEPGEGRSRFNSNR